MTTHGDDRFNDEIHEEIGSTKDQTCIDVQACQRECSDCNNYSNISKDLNLSTSTKFHRITNEFPQSVCSERKSSEHFYAKFIRKIDWSSLWAMSKEWIKNPMNLAIFVWIVCVAVSGAILFLVMTGMLNAVLPKKSQRDTWFEVSNQILNALFTLMCLYHHPRRIYHFVLLCRWHQNDILALRKIYCKNCTYKPNEYLHMMVVVIFLNLNCFAQYALCGLNLGYSRTERPVIGIVLCFSVSMSAPAFACVYNMLSPLGREYETEIDIEKHGEIICSSDSKSAHLKSLEKNHSMKIREDRAVEEYKPKWKGGLLFDFCDGILLAYLSVFCSCCVFGWNMERLGLGNMYVHITTFMLFCIAPFFIFNLAGLHLNSKSLRVAMGVSGILLCFLGLLYGGFWRIQMRKKYNLPANTFCFGKPSVTDCMQWLFCCSCALAQEVRTADHYDIVQDEFRIETPNENGQLVLPELPRDEGSPMCSPAVNSPCRETSSPSIFRMEYQITPSRLSETQTPENTTHSIENIQ